MKKISTFNKRFKVLMYIMEKGKVTRNAILEDFMSDNISGNAVNLILRELLNGGYICSDNALRGGYVYSVRSEFKDYLRLMLEASQKGSA